MIGAHVEIVRWTPLRTPICRRNLDGNGDYMLVRTGLALTDTHLGYRTVSDHLQKESDLATKATHAGSRQKAA